MRTLIALALGALLASQVSVARADAGSPVEYCRSVGTDDNLRNIPPSLVPEASMLFGLHAMPPTVVRHGTYFRCFAHRVWLCNVGANLPCGKANTARTLPGATTWCASHPDSPFIPLYASGHETIYRWHCTGTKAVAGAALFKVDPRGFIAQFWKPLRP